MTAGETPQNVRTEITPETERTINEYRDRGKIEQAMAFAQALGEMQSALGKIARALSRANFENDKDYEKANGVFGKKLAAALAVFQQMNNFGARDLAVTETRDQLKQLGVLAEKGPAGYPKPPFGMGFFKPSQVDLWLKDVETDPAGVAAGMANAARAADLEAQTAGAANPTEGQGRALTGKQLAKLNAATRGAFGINTGDE